MPFSFHVDENARVFHIQAIGEVNDSELMELSDRLQHEVAFVAGYPILCDCSKLTAVLISSNLIGSLARAARSRTNFVAIIASRPVVFGLARMYQMFSDPEDARIRVFSRAEEATAWLEMHVEGTDISLRIAEQRTTTGSTPSRRQNAPRPQRTLSFRQTHS
jgi:hypothetical protein